MANQKTRIETWGFLDDLTETLNLSASEVKREAREGARLYKEATKKSKQAKRDKKDTEAALPPFDLIELENWLEQEGIEYTYDIVLDRPMMMKRGWTHPLQCSTKLDTKYVIKPLCRLYESRGQKVPSPASIVAALDMLKNDLRGTHLLVPFIEEWKSNPTDREDVINWFLDIFGFEKDGEREALLTGICQMYYSLFRLPLEPDTFVTNPELEEEEIQPLNLMVCFVGAAGMGKSSVLEFLVSYLPTNCEYRKPLGDFDPTNKDNRIKATKMWVAEVNELERILKQGTDAEWKVFLEQLYDEDREAYHREWTRHIRFTVFFGTSNKFALLIDMDTNRRYAILAPKEGHLGGDGFGWPDLTTDPDFFWKVKNRDEERDQKARRNYDVEKAKELGHQIYWYLQRHPSAWRPSSKLIAFLEENNRAYLRLPRRLSIIESVYETEQTDKNGKVYYSADKESQREAWAEFQALRKVLDDKNLISISEVEFKEYIRIASGHGTGIVKLNVTSHANKKTFNPPYFKEDYRTRLGGHPDLRKLTSMQNPLTTSINVKQMEKVVQEDNDDLDYSSTDYEAVEENTISDSDLR